MDKTFHIMTFGCQMNANDSEWLARSLRALGFAERPFADARVQILNTCSVRGKPENKVYTELGRIRLLAAEHPERDVFACVGGCVAQQAGEKLFRRSGELRLVFGADGLIQVPEAVAMLAGDAAAGKKGRLALLDFKREFQERDLRLEADGGPCAFVNVMQGCDNFCAYCIVPFVRGRQKSRKSGAILDECRELVGNGAREITLLGQNVNSFGQDGQGDGSTFTELLYKTAELPGLDRLRFMTPHPKDMAPELIRAFGELDKLCPRLHLPLQSGSDRILERMGRKYDLARYLGLVEGLRAACPQIQLSTDIITGFPGETDEDFELTMQAAKAADFAASFSFVYSDRPGTRASTLKSKVPRKAALERLARLQHWQNTNGARILAEQLGREAEVLVEGRSLKAAIPDYAEEHSSFHGRTPDGFPVNIPSSALELKPGDLVKVKINGAGKHTLKGELCHSRP